MIKAWSTLAVLLLAGAIAGPAKLAAQPYFEFLERGASDPGVISEARRATLYSLASMAAMGAILMAPPKIYFAATKADCIETHLELGWTRPEGERRCNLFSGMSFPGAYIVNMEYIRVRQRDPAAFMWWLMPHELFHLYQWQAGPDFWRNTPTAFSEGAADMHKFKVLDERRIISMDAYVRRTLVPRAKAARARWNFSILDKPQLEQSNADAFYDLAGVLGYYLYLNGGWPKIVALNGDPSFRQRLEALYGTTPEAFQQEFFDWLGAQ